MASNSPRYHVEYARRAVKAIEKMDGDTRSQILAWIHKNLEDCVNPRLHGKPLYAKLKGQWRYRIGECRAIVEIIDKRVIILVLDVDHRSSIYNKQ